MKTLVRNYLLSGLCIVLVSFLFAGCHQKGCTNQSALNYDVTADQDDGSCITCTPMLKPLGFEAIDVVDNNSSSQFYHQTVAKIYLDQEVDGYSSDICGDEKSTVSMKIENLVNKNIFFSFSISSNGPVSVFTNASAFIDPLGTDDEGVVATDNTPPFSSINNDTFFLNLSSISYN